VGFDGDMQAGWSFGTLELGFRDRLQRIFHGTVVGKSDHDHLSSVWYLSAAKYKSCLNIFLL